MRMRNALPLLAGVTGSQWGLVTTAQAAARGVTRLDLSRLTDAGALERIAHGVYKSAGAPAGPFIDLQAAWLLTDSARLAEERFDDGPSGAVVMGESAARLHDIGDLRAERAEFAVPNRRQTQRPDVLFRTRSLTDLDITIREGLPVTTIERTIADLMEARTDLSLTADALADALQRGRLDLDRLAELLAPLAHRNGRSKGDGVGFVRHLLQIVGLDHRSISRRLSSTEGLGAMIAADFIERLHPEDLARLVVTPELRETLIRREKALSDRLRPVLDEMNSRSKAELPRVRQEMDELSASIEWERLAEALSSFDTSSSNAREAAR